MRITHASILTLITLVGMAAPSAQQKFEVLGPNQCLPCHDHDAEKQWYEKKELLEVRRLFPEKGANAGHINSLNQLEAAKSDEFANAIGLADKYDVNGACVACHATVYRGEANAGVSCESCHGPGSGYLKPHVTKGAYEESVAKYGMTKLVGNLQGWTQQCTNCHVMNDERLIKANHPSGDDFDLGKKFQPVSLHFKKMYAEADVAAIGRAELDGIVRRRRGLAPAAPVPATSPAATSVAEAPAPVAEPKPEAPTPQTPAAQLPTAAPTSEPIATPAPSTRKAAPRARVASTQAINLTAPPPGSPTSIEPPVPLPETAAAAPSPAAGPAPSVPEAAPVTAAPAESPASFPNTWLLLGAAAIVAGGAMLWWRGRKRRT